MAARWSTSGTATALHRCWIGQSRSNCSSRRPPPPLPRWTRRGGGVPVRAAAEAEQTALPDVAAEPEEEGVVCEECGGAGWLLCGFCKGKKNNVKSEESSRVYRRCPTCKAAGYILCPRCRVYRCITYPEINDS